MPTTKKRRGNASIKREVQEPIKSPKNLVFVKNRTRQKQVLQFKDEQLVLLGYEKVRVELDFETAKDKFSYWSDKNIIEIVKT